MFAALQIASMVCAALWYVQDPVLACLSNVTCDEFVTGGTKLGMIIARAKCFEVCGTTDFNPAPSLTCRCQSSGCTMLMLSVEAFVAMHLAEVGRQRLPAAQQRPDLPV